MDWARRERRWIEAGNRDEAHGRDQHGNGEERMSERVRHTDTEGGEGSTRVYRKRYRVEGR